MSRKKPVCVPYGSIVNLIKQGKSVANVAKMMNVSPSTVYLAIKQAKRGKHWPKAVKKESLDTSQKLAEDDAVQKALHEAKQRHLVPLSMCLQLPMDGHVEIKVRDSMGNLLGTLQLNDRGVMYKHPNQKLPADRHLGWQLLDRLMQLGLT